MLEAGWGEARSQVREMVGPHLLGPRDAEEGQPGGVWKLKDKAITAQLKDKLS